MLGQCKSTPQGDAQLIINLSAPPDLEYQPSYPGARGMDVSRCYGDVTLRFATKEISFGT